MKIPARARTRWLLVVVFAIGMAWVEAASVYYLRVMVDRLDPYQPNPLPMRGILAQVELVREAATLVMLLTVGGLAGRTRQTRLGYTAIAFGVWDIFYYVFLRMMCGWPLRLGHSLPAATTLVGARACACLHRVAHDRLGHVGAPACYAKSRNSGHVDVVAFVWDRSRARPLRVHGRLASRAAPRAGGNDDGIATGIQLADVRCGTCAHGRADRGHCLANTA